ncbi:MAG: immunity 17 family protein, partial [Anaerolineaceae bacterium]
MKTFVIVIMILGGLVLLIGAVLKWEWMLRTRRSRDIVQKLGIERGRIIYGVIGGLLGIVALALILFPQVSQPFTGKPDALAILSVEPDGCTVTRSEVAGMSSNKNLLWRITNQNFETVAFQSADDGFS